MNLDFIIIGGQKCGSSYLHDVIAQHPQIAMIAGECPHFESPDFEQGGEDKLVELLAKLDQEKLKGIKRPNYLSRPEVPDRIKAANKNIKLIAILRKPLERLKSAYFHYMRYGFSPILSLNVGVEKLLKGELTTKYPRTVELLDFGHYCKYLENYMVLFNESLLVLRYDDLVKDKTSIIRKCYSFLGVDKAFVPYKSLDKRPQKVTYSLLRTWLLNKKNIHQFEYNQDKTRFFVKEQSAWNKFVSNNIDLFDRTIMQKLINNNEKPVFKNHIREQLMELYLPDIERLENLLEFDLSLWKK